MFTVCPKCVLPLAVTAADLRAGQGYVRCGRCANVFNALLGLTDSLSTSHAGKALPSSVPTDALPDASPDAAQIATAAATASRPKLALPRPPTEKEPSPEVGLPPVPGAELESGSGSGAAPALQLIDSPQRAPPTWELTEPTSADLALRTEEVSVYGAAVVYDESDLPPRPLAPRAISLAVAPELAALRAATRDLNRNLNARDLTGGLEKLRALPAPRPTWHRVAATASLALLCAVQALIHWRNDLATHRAWHQSMRHLAALIGKPLIPNWDLNAYDVRQFGGAADSVDGNALRVRLSLANIGPQAQGLPLLRLTLLDRLGKPLSRGELKPEAYLPVSLQGQKFIDRGQRIDTEVRVQDPTQQAASFEVDVCMAAAGGGLRCANDSAGTASLSEQSAS